jgi:hypothetical protein
MTAHGFFLYGMWGPITDPGARTMTQRMATELTGINMHASPYRDYDVNTIVAEIMALPITDPVVIAGTSLGANNTPVVAAYVALQNAKRIIAGIWGFQASIYGEHAGNTPSYPGITPNVLFAHLFSSDTVVPVPGIGAYQWICAPGNKVTNGGSGKPIVTTTHLAHPGDYDVTSQDTVLAEMQRVIEHGNAA